SSWPPHDSARRSRRSPPRGLGQGTAGGVVAVFGTATARPTRLRPASSGLSQSPEPRSNAVRLPRFLLGSLALAALARPERSICCDPGWLKFSLELGGPFLSPLGREPGSRLAGCLLEP